MTSKLPVPDSCSAQADALEALPPRAAALLRLRFIQGMSLPECARSYGVSLEAMATHQLRAARAFVGASAPSAEEEAQAASALQASLSAVSPADALAAAILRLQRDARSVEAELQRRAQRHAASPARRREELLRKVLVGVLLALTAYFYVTRPEVADPSTRRAAPRRAIASPRRAP